MFFPIGWPRVLRIPESEKICSLVCNRDKILFAILNEDSVCIWYYKPCVPIVFERRSQECLNKHGKNIFLEWRPDSSMLVIATDDSYLLFYQLLDNSAEFKSLYEQKDSPVSSLKRDSAELFMREQIPSIILKFTKSVWVDGGISSLVCIRDELMISTKTSHIIRHKWDGTQNRDYSLDLRRIPFSIDQQISSSAVPLTDNNVYVCNIEYSPLVGGFAIVFNNGKAGFLTAHSLKFDPNQVQGVWARDLDDATCAAVNHKYRLIAFGRENSLGVVYYVDESTGALEVSHNLLLSTKDYPGTPGSVACLRWTPDSCAIALSWKGGGVAIWSAFGALLLCTLKWDYGLRTDPLKTDPFQVVTMEWSAEGYQLWMLKDSFMIDPNKNFNENDNQRHSVVQWEFVKSPLTVNPCMTHNGHIYLQGEDRLYINLGNKIGSNSSKIHVSNGERFDGMCNILSGTKQWLVVPIPNAYSSCNSPIRFTAIDEEGQSIAVTGKTGLAHYSMQSKKWKLFGNEYQERDFVVTGGLLWHSGFLIASSYSIPDNEDEIRVYPRDVRLDNNYVKVFKMSSQVLLLNKLKNSLLTFCANSQISIYNMHLREDKNGNYIHLIRMQTIDISGLCPHPACIVSANLTWIRSEISDNQQHPETLLLNVSGKLLMVQREHWLENTDTSYTCATPTVLASYVENLWVPWKFQKDKPHLTEAIWLFCGAHGMRVWLPLFPKSHQDKVHTFMSKRIMLPFYLKIYPLTILFEDAIILGTENDTVLYTSDAHSPFSLPFSVLELMSQVYLHQVLRQLIQRNLGYHAWEIARSCSSLPYFSHSLELLLHEVLEEEATSKEPIPDAQLPSIVEFIQEFPGIWARAVVQCARKTEIALWPYLFSVAGPPKKLLQNSLTHKELDTAASYLLILQNLEASSVSKQYATLLLDAALEQGRWELSRDLVRFLRAIDPKDVEPSSRNSSFGKSNIACSPQSSVLLSQEEDLALVLGTMQVSRTRSHSTATTPKLHYDSKDSVTSSSILEKTKNTIKRKKSVPSLTKTEKNEEGNVSTEEFFIDVILRRHAQRLLTSKKLLDLGCFAAQLDFHLITWMGRERDKAAKIDDYVTALRAVHEQFSYPYPSVFLQDISKLKNMHVNPLSPIESPNFDSDKPLSNIIDMPDSGYTSLPSDRIHYPEYVPQITGLNAALLKNSLVHIENKNIRAPDNASILSDDSAITWRDELAVNEHPIEPICWATANPLLPTELNSYYVNESVNRADVQLRYLLQLFLEAGCLGWAGVIAIVLRDTSAIARTVRAAYAPIQSLELTINLRDGLMSLTRWSYSECLGYKQFMGNIQGHISLLHRLIVNKQQIKVEQHIQQSPEQDTSLDTSIPSPGSSYISNVIGAVSRSQRSSLCQTPTTPQFDEEKMSEFSWSNKSNTYKPKNNTEIKENNVQMSNSTCILS